MSRLNATSTRVIPDSGFVTYFTWILNKYNIMLCRNRRLWSLGDGGWRKNRRNQRELVTWMGIMSDRGTFVSWENYNTRTLLLFINLKSDSYGHLIRQQLLVIQPRLKHQIISHNLYWQRRKWKRLLPSVYIGQESLKDLMWNTRM